MIRVVRGQMSEERDTRSAVGLCATCAHARVIESDRGSRFYMCERARTDTRFPRYPPLPVAACIGYDEKACTGSNPPG
jgi:hypothetical protein